jgi:hypothetical protein
MAIGYHLRKVSTAWNQVDGKEGTVFTSVSRDIISPVRISRARVADVAFS